MCVLLETVMSSPEQGRPENSALSNQVKSESEIEARGRRNLRCQGLRTCQNQKGLPHNLEVWEYRPATSHIQSVAEPRHNQVV